MRRKLIAGNWKMYKTMVEAHAYLDKFLSLYAESKTENEIAICAPYTQLEMLAERLFHTGVGVGAQNMHFEEEGAFTGEISAGMLEQVGVDYCIIGHSERRQYFGETDEIVNKKLHTAFNYGIIPIFCLGEVLEQRDAGEEFTVVKRQVEKGLAEHKLPPLV